jgi:hypothetical protein
MLASPCWAAKGNCDFINREGSDASANGRIVQMIEDFACLLTWVEAVSQQQARNFGTEIRNRSPLGFQSILQVGNSAMEMGLYWVKALDVCSKCYLSLDPPNVSWQS